MSPEPKPAAVISKTIQPPVFLLGNCLQHSQPYLGQCPAGQKKRAKTSKTSGKKNLPSSLGSETTSTLMEHLPSWAAIIASIFFRGAWSVRVLICRIFADLLVLWQLQFPMRFLSTPCASMIDIWYDLKYDIICCKERLYLKVANLLRNHSHV